MHARELVVCTQAVPSGRRAGLSDGACMDVFSIGFTPAARDTGADASRAFVLSVGAAAACSFAFEAEAVEVRVVCVCACVFVCTTVLGRASFASRRVCTRVRACAYSLAICDVPNW